MSWAGRKSFVDNWASLYTNQKDPEKAMEPVVAALGQRYRCQHPFWGHHFIVDFVLLDHKLIIEIDGDEHRTAAGKRKDKERDAKLAKSGWRVVRTTNAQALSDPGAALKQMLVEAKLTKLLKESEHE